MAIVPDLTPATADMYQASQGRRPGSNPNDTTAATLTANTAAIQAAIDYAFANNLQKVTLPPGIFYCDPGIYLDPPGNMRASGVGDPTMFSFSLHLDGEGGLYNNNGFGTQLRFLDNTTNGLIVGTGQGMRLSNFSVYGPTGAASNAGLSANGIGVALAGGSGGLSRALLENIGVENFRTGFCTGFNANGLCDSVTFIKCTAFNNYIGHHALGTQNYIQAMLACDFGGNTVHVLSDAGKSINIYGGNYSNSSAHRNAFTISGVSALSTVTDSTQLNGSSFGNRTFTATLTNPDQPMVDGAYDAFVINSTKFGPIPLILKSYNSGTKVATFTFAAGWVIGGYGAGFDDLSGPPATLLQSELQAATTLYACETATCFRGLSFNVDGAHIENPGVLTTLFDQQTGFNGDRACRFNALRFNYDLDQIGYHGGSASDEAVFQCQAVHPFMRLFNGAASYVEMSNITTATPANPVIIDAREQDDRLIVRNCPGFTPNIRVAQVNAFGDQNYGQKSIPTGFGEWDETPFVASADTKRFYSRNKFSGVPFKGFYPAQHATLSISPEIYTSVSGALGAVGTYPCIMGGVPYCMGLSSSQAFPAGPGSPVTRFAASNHAVFSYGQNLTITWNYYGRTNVVFLSDLTRMFAGLKIILNDGGGDKPYIVTGVYPTLGFITVWNSNSGATVLDGTEGTHYTDTTIKQEAYSFSTSSW